MPGRAHLYLHCSLVELASEVSDPFQKIFRSSSLFAFFFEKCYLFVTMLTAVFFPVLNYQKTYLQNVTLMILHCRDLRSH